MTTRNGTRSRSKAPPAVLKRARRAAAILRWRQAGASMAVIARGLGVGVGTVRRTLAELRAASEDPKMTTRPAGTPADRPPRYTLYVDRAGLCTDNPATETLGHAETWTELQALTDRMLPEERGGRLWAADNRRNRRVLHVADIRLANNEEDGQCG